MRVWDYLKSRMRAYGDRIAFSEGRVTYAQLIARTEKDAARGGGGTLCLARGESRREQAWEILRILAAGDVAVPTGDEYGKEREEKISAEVARFGKNADADLAFVMYTSGTTGDPKGVMLTHENIIENLKAISEYFRVKPGQKLLILRPLLHIAVLTGELLFGLCRGLELDFYEEAFLPARLARYIDETRAEIFCCTPTMMYHLSRYLKGTHVASAVLSGERLNERTAELLAKKYPNIDFYNVYGLTENSPRVSALCPRDFSRRVGSVGKPVRNTQVSIADGELLVRSKSVMSGYLGREDLTRQKLRDGWLHTGDAARFDADGYLYIDGRTDDMIIRGGLNIYPSEIERVVLRHPKVEQCLAYGRDDAFYGQKICLKVVGDVEREELSRYARAHLPAHLVPNVIEIVDRLELSASGKVKL